MTTSTSAQSPGDEAGEHARKREHTREQLRISYAAVFGGEHGRIVLADLLRTYGFTAEGIEHPSAVRERRAEDVFLIEGMKEPVRRILSMSGAKLSTNSQP